MFVVVIAAIFIWFIRPNHTPRPKDVGYDERRYEEEAWTHFDCVIFRILTSVMGFLTSVMRFDYLTSVMS